LRICLFCQQSGLLEKEHAYPDWVLNLLPGEKVGTSYYVSSKLPNMVRTWVTKEHTGVTVKAVCQTCNQGWMSRLEERAKTVLSPLLLGKGGRDLTGQDAALIVAWALKTSVVFDAASHRQHSMAFTPANRRHLMETLQPDPSLHASVFLAQYIGAREMHSDSYRLSITSDPSLPVESLNRLYCRTMVFGRLAVQVIVRRIVEDTDWPTIDRFWLAAHLDISRPIDGSVHWPPTVPLDDQRFLDFRDRWLPVEARKRRPL
jgi:hypothetical protein